MAEIGPWHKPGKYHAAPANFDPELMAQRNLPKRYYIKDDTLREGEETPGVVFTNEDRVEIAQHLQEVGIAEIEMFKPRSVEEARETISIFRNAGITMDQSFLGGMADPTTKATMDIIKEAGGDMITLLCGWPEGAVWSPGRKSLPKDELYGRVTETIQYGKKIGLKVCIGAPNTTRARIADIVDINLMFKKAGADRVHLYDSFGVGLPSLCGFITKKVKQAVGDTTILWHGHNDFGQAVANTIAAMENGATWCDVVVNGLGDRAGNAALEEVVCALEVLLGVDTGIKLEKLYDLSQFIIKKSGVKLQPHKAIVGKHAFLEESHFMIRKSAADAGYPEAVLPFVPELVGQKPNTVIGSSNLYVGAIEYLLEQWGMSTDAEVVEAVRNEVKTRIAGGNYLEEEEVNAIARQVLGK